MRIWAGSTAVRRSGWRFRFDHRDERLGGLSIKMPTLMLCTRNMRLPQWSVRR